MDSSWYDQKWNSSEGRMFDNFVPMFPEDVADQIVYCCTRPRHVQISDISSYATNQSYFSMKGVPPVARMGTSLGNENHNSDWQCHQQGWGEMRMGNMRSGNMMSSGNMMQNNHGRNSPRANNMHYPANFNFGNSSPRSYGQNGSGGAGGGGTYASSPRGSPMTGYRM
jgi:hypothetical protein